MFKTPTGLTLGVYSPDVIDAIESKGGKLGLLDLIGNNPELCGELKKAGILVGSSLSPIVLDSPHNGLTDEEYNLFQKYHNINQGQKNGPGRFLSDGRVMLRGSLPGDWRSLVDVIPSPTVEPTIESINEGIKTVLDAVTHNEYAIRHYAETTGVPFDKDKISVGVVSSFDVPIITITENPNNGDFYIDDFQGKLGGVTGGSKIYTSTTSSEGISKNSNNGNSLADLDKITKVKTMLSILERYGILVSDIAYQFEFGGTYFGNLILLQIKELSRKLPAIFKLRTRYPLRADKILSGGAYGYNLPIVPALTPREWMENRNTSSDCRESFAYFGNNSSDLRLNPHEIDPEMRGVFSGDSHNGSMVHNSFRYVQQTLQAGGIALLGDKIGGMFVDPTETNKTLKGLEGKTINVAQNQEGIIEISSYGKPDPVESSDDILGRLQNLTGLSSSDPYKGALGDDGKRRFIPKK